MNGNTVEGTRNCVKVTHSLWWRECEVATPLKETRYSQRQRKRQWREKTDFLHGLYEREEEREREGGQQERREVDSHG